MRGNPPATVIVLPSFDTKSVAALNVSSESRCRDNLDKLHHRYRIYEVIPMNCSGRSVAAAKRVMEIDEVFVAMIALGFMAGHMAAKILRLTCSSSVAAWMSSSASMSASVSGRDRLLKSSLTGFFGYLSRGNLRAMLPLMVARLFLILFRCNVIDHDVEPCESADMGDSAAHLSGADDCDLADRNAHEYRIARSLSVVTKPFRDQEGSGRCQPTSP